MMTQVDTHVNVRMNDFLRTTRTNFESAANVMRSRLSDRATKDEADLKAARDEIDRLRGEVAARELLLQRSDERAKVNMQVALSAFTQSRTKRERKHKRKREQHQIIVSETTDVETDVE